jgi:hypothetical protein
MAAGIPQRFRCYVTGVIQHIGVVTQIHAACAAMTAARRHGKWMPDKVNDSTRRFIPMHHL